jgi:hypothetical protein
MRFYRCPQTTQERRAASVAIVDPDLVDLGVRVRAKRNPTNIVDAFDDIGRTYTRSWKDHRGSQWKQ